LPKLDLEAARNLTIPDVLPAPGADLRVLFCGINPGLYSAATWLYVAVTHSAVTLAAHLSRLIAADLTATEPPDLSPYRPARF
jgi:double-stranded uracil-DNA glycosylase